MKIHSCHKLYNWYTTPDSTPATDR